MPGRDVTPSTPDQETNSQDEGQAAATEYKKRPRPAALAAASILRPIWLAESSKTRLAGSTTAVSSGMIACRAWVASWPMYRTTPSASGSVLDLRTWRRAEPSSCSSRSPQRSSAASDRRSNPSLSTDSSATSTRPRRSASRALSPRRARP